MQRDDTELSKKPSKAAASWYRFIPADGCDDVANQDATPRMLWKGFKERTTAHGIPHVDQGRGTSMSAWLFKRYILQSSRFCKSTYLYRGSDMAVDYKRFVLFRFECKLKIIVIKQLKIFKCRFQALAKRRFGAPSRSFASVCWYISCTSSPYDFAVIR